MVNHIMRYAINNIGRIVNCGGNTGFHTTITVTSYINNECVMLHSLEVFTIDYMIFARSVPQNSVDNHIELGQFLLEKLFGFAIILHHFSTHIIKRFDCSTGDIASPENCGSSIVRENTMTHIRMKDCCLTRNLIVAPKTVPSIFVHILPSKRGEFTSNNLICNIPILNSMHPAKDCLTIKLFQILCITNLGVSNNVFHQYLISRRDVYSHCEIIIIRVSQNITITILNKYLLGVLDEIYITWHKRSTSFVLFM